MTNVKTQKLPSVTKCIRSAYKAERSVMAYCVEGAQLAVKQLDESLSIDKAIDKVIEIYKDEFTAGNMRRNFKDALTIAACREKTIAFELPSKKGATVVDEKPEDILKRGKHAINSAAATIRGTKGSKTPAKNAINKKPVDTPPATPSQIVHENKVQQKAYWDTFAKGFHSDEWVAELKDALKSQGYRLTKIPAKK